MYSLILEFSIRNFDELVLKWDKLCLCHLVSVDLLNLNLDFLRRKTNFEKLGL
jgi:hypothetical protein